MNEEEKQYRKLVTIAKNILSDYKYVDIDTDQFNKIVNSSMKKIDITNKNFDDNFRKLFREQLVKYISKLTSNSDYFISVFTKYIDDSKNVRRTKEKKIIYLNS